MHLEHLYGRLPVLMQNWACSIQGRRLHSRRYDKGFGELFATVKQRVDIAPSQLEVYRQERMRDHLRAAARSPFWSQQFRTWNVNVNATNALAELAKLPVIDKQIVKVDCARILTHVDGQVLIPVHTSGTTGSGLVFKTTRLGEQEQWATWWRYREWHGISRQTWCGYFGGRSLVPLRQKEPPFWRTNRSGRQMMFSAYHLRPETTVAYVQAINQNSLAWLHGYPSLLALLARYIVEQQLVLEHGVRLVTTGAENLLPHQKRIIEQAFGCPVREHYGMAEAVANISQWPDGALRVDEDFAFVEFEKIPNAGSAYRVIGSNWSNPAFPLLRYDTGDVVEPVNDGDVARTGWRAVCTIDGRNEDYVTLPNRVRLGRLDHVFKDLTEIREAQIYQPEIGTVVLRIVKGNGYNKRSEATLLLEARRRFGEQINLEIEYLAEIARTKTGKLKFVISDVKQ